MRLITLMIFHFGTKKDISSVNTEQPINNGSVIFNQSWFVLNCGTKLN
jgi:hypothetical protein